MMKNYFVKRILILSAFFVALGAILMTVGYALESNIASNTLQHHQTAFFSKHKASCASWFGPTPNNYQQSCQRNTSTSFTQNPSTRSCSRW